MPAPLPAVAERVTGEPHPRRAGEDEVILAGEPRARPEAGERLPTSGAVDLAPAEREHLASAQPGERRGQEDRRIDL
jgi:hypothetical protein